MLLIIIIIKRYTLSAEVGRSCRRVLVNIPNNISNLPNNRDVCVCVCVSVCASVRAIMLHIGGFYCKKTTPIITCLAVRLHCDVTDMLRSTSLTDLTTQHNIT